jgi:2-polyprenyl-6-methoxyphenol hydroxylase-like FAD-dependent oxidoreductase
MAKQLGSTAIVVGAGIGGLAAAAALASRFDKVLVLDRDALPNSGEPRAGIGQGSHTHTLLKGGEASLETLLPGFTEALYREGGIKLRVGMDLKFFDFGGMMPDCDAGFAVTAMSRPLYEKVLRDMVAAQSGVDIRFGVDVKRFQIEGRRCTGVELETGERLAADLVVDATGMNGPLAQQLAEDGHAAFETQNVKINVVYATAKFRQPPKYRGERLGFFVLPGPPSPYFGLMLPIEDNQWIVSLGGRGANVPPRDLDGFRDYASKYPTQDIYERIRDAEPTSDIRLFRKTFATRRRFDKASWWPERLIPIGDAISSVNPTYGQGMSVAALQAGELARQLGERGSLDGLTAAYIPAAFAISERAWGLAINSDYVYPETEGERPPNFPVVRNMAAVLRRLAQEDVDFRIYRQRMGHMLETDAGLREGPLAMRFFAALQGSMAPPA